MPGLYSHTVFGDSEPFVKQLEPSKPVVEFSSEAAQAKREERATIGAGIRKKLRSEMADMWQDGFRAGAAGGWRKGFLHGMAAAAVLVVLGALFLANRWSAF